MNSVNVDCNNSDSDLFCKYLVPKRKALEDLNPKKPKQGKLITKMNESNKGKSEETDDFSKADKMDSANGQNSSSKLNESTSSYFHTKKSTNTCPLCLKPFRGDSVYSAHMKQCAKTHKMTTQQLLGSLELQKKQMQERRNLGLLSQRVPVTKQNTKKKTANRKESYDLALGLALSKSLADGEPRAAFSEETQKTTLEEFGFTSSNTVVVQNRRKPENDKRSILKEQTTEERQRIIIEKVAVVLLEEDEGRNSETKKLNQISSWQNNQIPQLWNLGESNDRNNWYVQDIKSLLLWDEVTEERSKETLLPENIDREITKLNLPQREIFENWKKMINNSFKSDLSATTKDGQNVYLHSLVVFARCPKILENDCESIFQKYNLSTFLIFSKYLYCGILEGLIRSEVNDLYGLANELNFSELVTVLNCLKSSLLKGAEDSKEAASSSVETRFDENEAKTPDRAIRESKNIEILEDNDLFTDGVDLSKSNHKSDERNLSENESNADKSFWSFIHHEKKMLKNEEINREQINNLSLSKDLVKPNRKFSEDSATKDLDDIIKGKDVKSDIDCIVLSSGSDGNTEDNFVKSRTPSPAVVDYEVPYFDPYDNFHCFSEEQFSPVGLHSQSLLMGDISTDSLKLSNPAEEGAKKGLDSIAKEEPKRTIGYCSTPVTVRQTSKVKSSRKNSLERSKRRKKSDLSANRILRKSLGLHQKSRKSKPGSAKKKKGKRLVEELTNSIFSELSKASSPFRSENFLEITLVQNREEFKESVTPSPNYSNMGESMLKEQLAKYGLKKSLAKSKAKKILRHIYEELHPLYNTETGKIVKIFSRNSPKAEKKSKVKKVLNKNTKQTKKEVKSQLNSSKGHEESSDESTLGLDGGADSDSSGSEFEDLNETLTQTMPSNPDDLPSAFCEFLQSHTEYHQKILLYEPIWLEELQKKLKETFKKHFKISDLMDYLDQKCITFRSESQAKNIQRRRENSKKRKTPPS